MNRSKSLFLPLYCVTKTKTRILNERNLIYIIILISVFSLIVIFKNLPTNTHEDESIKNLFIPKLINNNGQILHNDDAEHQKYHRDKVDIKIDENNKMNIKSPEDDRVFSKDELDDEKENQKAADKLVYVNLADEPKEKMESNENLEMHSKESVDEVIQPELKESENQDIIEKRNKVKEMTLHAWNGYKKYAWGENELRPLSKTGHSAGIFGGRSNLGASIVDALDTLYIMGFEKEFTEGKEWIKRNLNLNTNAQYSAFEINIRFIGGLLSLYALSEEKIFLTKAEEIAEMLLPIFDSPTGIPYSLYNPKTKQKQNYPWAAGSCSILAEYGSLSLEFTYLSDLTGNPKYKKKVDKIFDVLAKVEDRGLYYNYINPNTGKWCNNDATLGALADSFYEYLLKLWVYGNKKDDALLEKYLRAMKAARSHLIGKSTNGLTYAGEYSHGRLQAKMGHLACFSGGMFALTAMKVDSLTDTERNEFKQLAADITNTCHESYIKTETHIGPETFHFNTGNEAIATSENEKYYILRPEVVEAYFYLWRLTKDNKYREWAWDVVQAIDKYCRTDNGFSGIKNVYNKDPVKDDVQQSFFFAETLKYLYLIFNDDDTISFDKYVFNTEAHPFLIKKTK